MRIVHLAQMILLAPMILGVSVVRDPDEPPETLDEKREALEKFIHQLDAAIESQIEEIIALLPNKETDPIRARHYSWRQARDIKCAERGRTEDGELVELECRSQLAEEYYQKLEVRIAQLQARRDANPRRSAPPHNQQPLCQAC